MFFGQQIFPEMPDGNVQIFYATTASAVSTAGSQVWVKPPGIRWVFAWALDSGGGGGGGATGASGTSRGGGGGGSGGACASLICPALFVPDVLYVNVARGGAGGTAGNPGGAGARSFIWFGPESSGNNNRFLMSGNNGPAAGGAGTSGTGGAGGSAGGPVAANDFYGQSLGIWSGCTGQNGAAGGAQTGAVGGALSWSANNRFGQGGCGGGGVTTTDVNNAGGALTGAGFIPSLAGGTAGGGDGQHGVFFLGNPFFGATGGTGGGTNGASGTGGRGGDGAYGCGGGGGGGGVTGGAGGRGGDGLVLIACW